jgi:hypothetical protein
MTVAVGLPVVLKLPDLLTKRVVQICVSTQSSVRS